MKNKKTFLLAYFVGIFFAAGFLLTLNSQKAFADTCSTQKPGFACTDTLKVSGATGCVANLCPGLPAAVKCCALSADACKADGSTSLQPCLANGVAGACNMAGNCIAGSGAVSTTTNSAPTTASANGTTFINPLRFSNVEEFLGGIMTAIQKIIVVLALVFIMIGAVMILSSAGNSGMVEKGKGAITMALVGLALGVAAPSLLKELANIIGWGGASAVAGALTLTQIAMRVLNFLLGTMGIIALVMLVIGAIMYLTSAGDEDRIDKGKEIFKYSLIGVVLAMSAMILVTQIAKFFQ